MFNVVGYCWNTGPRFVSTRFVLRFDSSRFDSKQNSVHVWVGCCCWDHPWVFPVRIKTVLSLPVPNRFNSIQFLTCSGLDSWFDLVPSWSSTIQLSELWVLMFAAIWMRTQMFPLIHLDAGSLDLLPWSTWTVASIQPHTSSSRVAPMPTRLPTKSWMTMLERLISRRTGDNCSVGVWQTQLRPSCPVAARMLIR